MNGRIGSPGYKRAVLELCVDEPAGLAAAAAGGADRIELTSALSLGGLTPSPGFMRLARDCGIPTIAMIRPRAGSFVFSADEVSLMIQDIAEARAHELAGVVLGVARPDGTLDTKVLKRLVDAAGPMQTCLHRVFDLTPDPFAAIDQAVEMGFTRILSAGQKTSVPDGLDLLVELQAYAGNRISIMPGGGITLKNVGQVIRSTGITEIHTSCSRVVAPADDELVRFGFAPEGPRKAVDPEAVAEMRRMLAAIAAPDPEIEPARTAQGTERAV
jgi:copper homeostasis protein